ncbi:protein asteroid homolog 1-like [Saccostrea echinata]|uniref:protein asteroid homolog 1-like n=1 Tax=Saccostrea echinata TaxID=191078 RepID=UPI002A81AFC8|nr:protein asteroid homolog 1-like [Saccostrea echinata]
MAQSPIGGAVKALQLELKKIREEPVEGFRVNLMNDDSLFEWEVAIFGPPGTMYEGGYFKAHMKFPQDYPYNPPSVKFISKMWHPNVYENGDVCISILHPPVDDPQSGELPSERWNPTQNVRTILLSIISLLNEPNTFSPANVDASVMYRKWKDSKGKDKEYENIIRKQVQATKEDAERDGVNVPTTLQEYFEVTMGIRGLNSFIQKNECLFLKSYELKHTELVIDGPNILHKLFETNTDMKNLYGGDYNKFAVVIREFFRSLESCGVCPIVVMDGGHAVDNRKLATRKERAEQRFSSCRSESSDGYKNLPILGYNLFIEVLRDMGIQVRACKFEADKEIAVIANEKGCPVLSQDSDFYVVRIVGGFLPFDLLKKEKNNDHFPAKIYHVEDFISQFPKLGEDVFPLIAILFGNDYTKDKDFQPFLKSLPIPKTTTSHALEAVNKYQMKIIHWLLQMESFQIAKNQIEGVMEGENIENILTVVVNAYSLDQPSLPCAVPLPEWFLLDHENCIIASIFMTIITSQRIFLSSQPEDFKSPSSYQCSKSLRQILYSILLKDCGKPTVEEFDRKAGIPALTLDTCVLPVYDKIGHFTVPGLTEIGANEAKTVDDRKELVKTALQLGSQFDAYETEDPELSLLLGLTSFWYKNSTPQVTACHLSSLIVCWIMLGIEHRVKNPTGPSKDNTIGRAVSRTDSQVLGKIYGNLTPYCEASTSTTKETRSDIVHAFAQFQTCAISAHDLNSILRFPFPSFHVEHLFFGKFLHDFCIAIEMEPNRDEFNFRILEADNGLSDLYKNIIQEFKKKIS